MKTTNYIKPFIKVRALGTEAVLQSSGNTGLQRRPDGSYGQDNVTNGSPSVDGSSALSKGNLWGLDEEDE